MEAREPESRALRTGKKEPAYSWRSRDPHRTINSEAFRPFLDLPAKIVVFRESNFLRYNQSRSLGKVIPDEDFFPR
jgi:hypothetical protein